MEEIKEKCSIEEYSIAQMILEQIFNFFACQQEEETRDIQGMKRSEKKWVYLSIVCLFLLMIVWIMEKFISVFVFEIWETTKFWRGLKNSKNTPDF